MSTATKAPKSSAKAHADNKAALDAALLGGSKTPESAEVRAAPKAAASKKYPEALKKTAKRAEQIRGRARSVGPVQVERVKSALGKTKPADVVGSFASEKDAIAYASGNKDVKPTDLVKQLSKDIADPFASSHGLVSVCLALAGK
jgi:hypothetical protein